MENHLSGKYFIKVQKSFLVAKDKINAIGVILPVSEPWAPGYLKDILLPVHEYYRSKALKADANNFV